MSKKSYTTRKVNIGKEHTTYMNLPGGLMISVNPLYKSIVIYSAEGYSLHYGHGLREIVNYNQRAEEASAASA